MRFCAVRREPPRTIYKSEQNWLTLAGNEPGAEETPTGFERSPENRVRVLVFTKLPGVGSQKR